MKVIIHKTAHKSLVKIYKADSKSADKIQIFLDNLALAKNPKNLPNATKMQGYDDERYRWRVGHYRVIGLIKDKELIIQIIKISSREGAYKGNDIFKAPKIPQNAEKTPQTTNLKDLSWHFGNVSKLK